MTLERSCFRCESPAYDFFNIDTPAGTRKAWVCQLHFRAVVEAFGKSRRTV